MYIKDAWELLKSMEEQNVEPNINILNSLTFLYATALRPEELEAKVLPLYKKYKINQDVYTYQHLIRMYLYTRDTDMVLKLYDRLKTKEKFEPNRYVLNNTFEAAMRTKSSDRMVELLDDFVRLKLRPHETLLKKIS